MSRLFAVGLVAGRTATGAEGPHPYFGDTAGRSKGQELSPAPRLGTELGAGRRSLPSGRSYSRDGDTLFGS